MLEHLTKKELRTLLKMVDSSHRNSLQYGITVLKKLNYDRNVSHAVVYRIDFGHLGTREKTSGNIWQCWYRNLARCALIVLSVDVVTWSNDHVMRWVELVGLGEYTSNLGDSGIHGGVIALDNDFSVETLALALKIPQAHQEVSRVPCIVG